CYRHARTLLRPVVCPPVGRLLPLPLHLHEPTWCGHPRPHPLLRGRADGGGHLVRHRAVHRAGRDGRGVGHRGRRR
ncbi:unnamed protein product, partial [Ectocarpus sp. 8 AP-2014]